MPKALDLTGQKFRKLTATKLTKERGKRGERIWECLCECGKLTLVATGALTSGNTGSCGCAEGFRRHGGFGKGSYNTWRAMMRRCYNPKDKDYSKYGAAGVIVQTSWHDYLEFEKDMGEPEGAQTLHRVDPYGDYTKENCVWASPTTQAREIRLTKRNKTGHIGVRIRNGKYIAGITAQKKKIETTPRATLAEAVEDRRRLEHTYWGKNNG